MKIRTALPAVVAVLGIALAGCSSDKSTGGMDMGSGSTAGTSAEAGIVFNDADVMFTQMMYPHHAQAVEMADLAEGRTENPAILDLATQISGAQAPEMEQMTTLLASFGQPAPSADMGDMGGMDHSGTSGMMTAEDMTALEATSGTEFDQMWLTMMVAHHTGAIEMANTELADGSNPDTQQLATDIIAAQKAEIETMNGLLAQG